MTQYTTDGIVLRVTEFRESDRIVLFYTRDLGKVSALARHATKSRKRFGTQLNVFQLLRLDLKQKPNRSLALLERVKPLTTLSGIYQDWRRIAAACLVADLANEMTREGSANPKVFDACRDALMHLHQGRDWQAVLGSFEYNLLSASGYRPAVRACVVCRHTWDQEENAYWVHGAGGAHCRDCLPHGARFEILRPEMLSRLAQIASGEAEDETMAQCTTLLYDFIRYQLGRPVRAWQFLEEMGLLESALH